MTNFFKPRAEVNFLKYLLWSKYHLFQFVKLKFDNLTHIFLYVSFYLIFVGLLCHSKLKIYIYNIVWYILKTD